MARGDQKSRRTPVLSSIGLAVLALVVGGCASPHDGYSSQTEPAAASSTESSVRTLIADGIERQYRVFVPEGATAADQLPVLIAVHGAGGNAQRMADYTGLSDVAARDGFIVVYPEGTQAAEVEGELSWNAGVCCGIPARTGVNDVAFIESVIQDVIAHFAADPARVFVAGFSNGGMLANRLACESREPIAGIAVVAGALSVTECAQRSPMPVVIVHGTADATVPYEGGATNPRTGARFGSWVNPSVQDATHAWLGANGCEASSNSVLDAEVVSVSFDSCAAGEKVLVVTIEGGKHVWPRSSDSRVDATALIVEYFGLSSLEATLAR